MCRKTWVVQGYSRDAWLADFIFREMWNRKLVFVTRDLTREEPEFLIDIRDFTTLFYVILRRKSSKC